MDLEVGRGRRDQSWAQALVLGEIGAWHTLTGSGADVADGHRQWGWSLNTLNRD